MSRYLHVFRHRHTVLPVIHVDSPQQALRNTHIAREAGADGVFLINHGLPPDTLLEIHSVVANAHADWWIGVNCLGLTSEEVFATVTRNVSGVWADDAGISESQYAQPYAERVQALRDSRVPDCLYFGGVAFKHQRQVEDLEAASQNASRYMDVVTTSGPATGQAADIEKIARMRAGRPLAIASGITPENVAGYLPHADSFLVATGISRSFTELEPSRVRELVQCVRAYEAPWKPSWGSRHDANPPVSLLGIEHGAEFEIDLAPFPEENPMFAYVDDVGSKLQILGGFVTEGRLKISNRPSFAWLSGDRDCVLLEATPKAKRLGRAAFRSLGVGEFCVEIYHVAPDRTVRLLHQDDFCFK